MNKSIAAYLIERICTLKRHPFTKKRNYYYGTITFTATHCWCGAKGEADATIDRAKAAYYEMGSEWVH